MAFPILGFVGASGSGKSTLARRLSQEHGFVALQMGRPLKDMLKVLGLTELDVAGTPEERARPQPLLGGKSARYAMSTLGTDWARNMITTDIWANVLRLRLEKHFDTNPSVPVVVDDLRFPNDWAAVQRYGGVILTVRRPAIERSRTFLEKMYYRSGLAAMLGGRALLGWKPIHETEFHWPDAPSVGEVWNTGTIDELITSTLAYWRQIGIDPGKTPV